MSRFSLNLGPKSSSGWRWEGSGIAVKWPAGSMMGLGHTHRPADPQSQVDLSAGQNPRFSRGEFQERHRSS